MQALSSYPRRAVRRRLSSLLLILGVACGHAAPTLADDASVPAEAAEAVRQAEALERDGRKRLRGAAPFEASHALALKALRQKRKALGPHHPRLGTTYKLLADVRFHSSAGSANSPRHKLTNAVKATDIPAILLAYERALRGLNQLGDLGALQALDAHAACAGLMRAMRCQRPRRDHAEAGLRLLGQGSEGASHELYPGLLRDALGTVRETVGLSWGLVGHADRRFALRPYAEAYLTELRAKHGTSATETIEGAVQVAQCLLGRPKHTAEVGAALEQAVALHEEHAEVGPQASRDAVYMLAQHLIDRGQAEQVLPRLGPEFDTVEAHYETVIRSTKNRGADPTWARLYAEKRTIMSLRKQVSCALARAEAYREAAEGARPGSKTELVARAARVLEATTTLTANATDSFHANRVVPAIAVSRLCERAIEELGDNARAALERGAWRLRLAQVQFASRRHRPACATHAEAIAGLANAKEGSLRTSLSAQLAAAEGFMQAAGGSLVDALAAYDRAWALGPAEKGVSNGEDFTLALNRAALAWALERHDEAHEALDVAMRGYRRNEAVRMWAEEQATHFDPVRMLVAQLGRHEDSAIFAQTLAPPGPLSPAPASIHARDAGQLRQALAQQHVQRAALLEAFPDARRYRGQVFDFNVRQLQLARAMLEVGQHDIALAELLDTVHFYEGSGLTTLSRRTFAQPHTMCLLACEGAARAMAQRGLDAEAMSLAERAMALYEGFAHVLDQRAPPPIQSELHKQSILLLVDWSRTPRPPLSSRAPELFARLLAERGDIDASLDVIARAQDPWIAALGDDHPRVARLELERARVLLRGARLDPALASATSAHERLGRALGEEHPEAAAAALVLGDVLLRREEPQAARQRYEQAREVLRAALLPGHALVLHAENGVAMADHALGAHDQAIARMRALLTTQAVHLKQAFAGATHPERVAASATTQWLVANWLHVTRDRELGHDEVLQLVGRAHRALATEARLLRDPDKRTAKLLRAVEARRRRVARLAHEAPMGRTGWRWPAWREAYAKAKVDLDAAEKQLLKASRPLREAEAKRSEVSSAVLADVLDEDGCLAHVVLAGGHYVAWILRPEHGARRVEIGTAEVIDPALATLRDRCYDPEEHGEDAWVNGAHAARDALRPLLEAIDDPAIKTLYLVVDGALTAAPLELLPIGADTRLADRFEMVRLHAPEAVLARRARAPSSRGMLLLGDADYDWTPPSDAPVITGKDLTILGRVPSMRRFDYLPGTAQEVGEIAAQYRKAKGKKRLIVLTGEAARERFVREHAAGTRVLHFATHGYLRERLNARLRAPKDPLFRLNAGLEQHTRRFDPMLLSGLALTGVNKRYDEGEDDGLLTGLEILDLPLDAALVFLSACETATSIDLAGEGCATLVRAFRIAGARQVLGSLWPVNDQATRVFARAFYGSYFKRGDAARALREARSALRTDDRFDHPRHWAAFVLYGPAGR